MSLDDRNDELNRKIGETNLPDAVISLAKTAKQNRNRIRLLAISIILDILLTIGLGLLAVQTHTTANKAESNSQALVASCQSVNDARANNKTLWDYLLSLPTPIAPTLQQQQVRNQFSVFLNKTFAQKNCDQLEK